jgi:hypothetical protein
MQQRSQPAPSPVMQPVTDEIAPRVMDQKLKRSLLNRYEHQVMHTSSCAPQTHAIDYLNEERNTKKRYFNNQVVCTNGTKYIDILAKTKKET